MTIGNHGKRSTVRYEISVNHMYMPRHTFYQHIGVVERKSRSGHETVT